MYKVMSFRGKCVEESTDGMDVPQTAAWMTTSLEVLMDGDHYSSRDGRSFPWYWTNHVMGMRAQLVSVIPSLWGPSRVLPYLYIAIGMWLVSVIPVHCGNAFWGVE